MKSLARETPRQRQAPLQAIYPPPLPMGGGGGGGFGGFDDATAYDSSGIAALYCACDLCRARQLALDDFDHSYAGSNGP